MKELISQLDESIENSVNPGFRLLYDFIKETRSQANQFHGVWSLPNGDEFYALRLKVYTTTDYSAQDIHDIGLSEVDRITKRMQAIALDLGYGEEVNVGNLMNKLNEAQIEFRRGSAGGGNQLRQPYLKNIVKKDEYKNVPITDHIHFYGFYIGNYPSLTKRKILQIYNFLKKLILILIK